MSNQEAKQNKTETKQVSLTVFNALTRNMPSLLTPHNIVLTKKNFQNAARQWFSVGRIFSSSKKFHPPLTFNDNKLCKSIKLQPLADVLAASQLNRTSDCLQAGKPFPYITNHKGQLSLPSLRNR